MRRQERDGGLPGVILDHRCGSGNIAEFLLCSGHRVHCTDVSSAALQSIERRFRDLGIAPPPTNLIDLDRPLRGQLPKYDHVIAWQSLYYADIATVRANISDLVADLSQGGVFILCLPTEQDLAIRHSEPMGDGSRRLVDNISGQQGAVLTVPDSAETLRAWCAGIAVRDVVLYRMEFDGKRSEFYALYGVND